MKLTAYKVTETIEMWLDDSFKISLKILERFQGDGKYYFSLSHYHGKSDIPSAPHLSQEGYDNIEDIADYFTNYLASYYNPEEGRSGWIRNENF